MAVFVLQMSLLSSRQEIYISKSRAAFEETSNLLSTLYHLFKRSELSDFKFSSFFERSSMEENFMGSCLLFMFLDGFSPLGFSFLLYMVSFVLFCLFLREEM